MQRAKRFRRQRLNQFKLGDVHKPLMIRARCYDIVVLSKKEPAGRVVRPPPGGFGFADIRELVRGQVHDFAEPRRAHREGVNAAIAARNPNRVS